jgi:parallel beta-helix repeat protein
MNLATKGGGADNGNIKHCSLTVNSATSWGGGAYYGTLEDCTLTGNSAAYGGGGAYISTLNDCVVSNNVASYAAAAFQVTLNNCVVSSNSATGGYGALGYCTLNNCTVTGNSATSEGGGAFGCTARNSIIYYNSAQSNANYDLGASSKLSYCSTIPPPVGAGNITNEPLFVDFVAGDFRLQSNSPCINSGSSGYAPAGPDLGGNPRVVGGTVDIGAYEFQFPKSTISYAWLQQYGLPTDGSADSSDPEGDGMSNYKEWVCGTDPTNPVSVLKMFVPSNTGEGISITWASVSGITYFLQRSTNIDVQSAFVALQSNLVGQPVMTTFLDTNAPGLGPHFYRVGVQP